jgi:hypothetical protein
MLLRRVLAVATATTTLFAALPARADGVTDRFGSPFGPADGQVPEAKKVVVLALAGGAVVSFGLSVVFLVQANSAETDRKNLLSDSGGAIDTPTAQCRTATQCSLLGDFRQKRDDATDRWTATMLIGGGLAAATIATVILWPNAAAESVHVTPQAGPNGGGLSLEGRF